MSIDYIFVFAILCAFVALNISSETVIFFSFNVTFTLFLFYFFVILCSFVTLILSS